MGENENSYRYDAVARVSSPLITLLTKHATGAFAVDAAVSELIVGRGFTSIHGEALADRAQTREAFGTETGGRFRLETRLASHEKVEIRTTYELERIKPIFLFLWCRP